jgi:hypothetical protein
LAAGWVAWTVIRAGPGLRRAGTRRLLTLDRPFPAEGRFPGDPYIGSNACAGCHPGEFALHARSGHAVTLRVAGRRALAQRLDGITLPDPERPEVRWSYQYRDGQLQLTRDDQGRVEHWILDYAFGSGHHATTFVNVLDPWAPQILEHRLTHYTREDVLDITPAQNADSRMPDITPHGRVMSPKESRKCFGCHSTQLSARDSQRIDEETMIPNISCERCHGPGRSHVLGARRGAPEAPLSMPFGLDQWTAETQMALCGTCHRHPSRARPGQIRPDDPQLARFQPVGIMQSRCYRESGGSFSCVNCHDPHARASADRASYNTVCLDCHSGRSNGTHPPIAANHPVDRSKPDGAPCPVSPRGNCVECHMPRVDSGQHVLFTDHWIRIRQSGESPPRPRRPAHNLDLLEPAEP